METNMRNFQSLDRFEVTITGEMTVHPQSGHIVVTVMKGDVDKDIITSKLWVMNADGSNACPLVQSEGQQANPRFSKDGSKLLWIDAATGKPQIQVAAWNGTGIDDASLVATELDEAPGLMDWSPCGTKISYMAHVAADPHPLEDMPHQEGWADKPEIIDHLPYKVDGAGFLHRGGRQIFIWSLEDDAHHQLTDTPSGVGSVFYQQVPMWSEDGSRIFFIGESADDTINDPRNTDLYAVDLNGIIEKVVEFDGLLIAFAPSPDGDKFALIGSPDQTAAWQTFKAFVAERGKVTALQSDFDRSLADGLDNYGRAVSWLPNSDGFLVLYDDCGHTRLGQFMLDGTMSIAVNQLCQGSSGYGMGTAFAQMPDGGIVFNRGVGGEWPELRNSNGDTLTSFNKGISKKVALAQPRYVSFTNPEDDLALDGWLYVPADYVDGKTYPMILEIHGGPNQNFGDRFWPRLQSMTGAGYCVFMMNPRGSTSYGHDFAAYIEADYPNKDVSDLLAGVEAACAHDCVDPDRVFVTGISGGGTLTTALVTQTDRFRAAASLCPFVEWTGLRLGADVTPFVQQMMPEQPWENPDNYVKHSTIYQAGNVTTPTMMQAGELDHRTPFYHAELFYQALKFQGVETVLVRFVGENHGTASRPSHGIQSVELLLNWFKRFDVSTV